MAVKIVHGVVAVRDSFAGAVFAFLHAGRSGYILVCGLALLVLHLPRRVLWMSWPSWE